MEKLEGWVDELVNNREGATIRALLHLQRMPLATHHRPIFSLTKLLHGGDCIWLRVGVAGWLTWKGLAWATWAEPPAERKARPCFPKRKVLSAVLCSSFNAGFPSNSDKTATSATLANLLHQPGSHSYFLYFFFCLIVGLLTAASNSTFLLSLQLKRVS